MNEDYNVPAGGWINVRNLQSRFLGGKEEPGSRIDKTVSRIVGKEVYAADPRLVRWVVEKKKMLPEGEDVLSHPEFIEELKQLFK